MSSLVKGGFLKVPCKWHVIGSVCLVVCFFFIALMMPLCFAADFNEADGAIREAEQDMGLAFLAVADAEGSGADVSALLIKLDVASGFLSEAQYAFDVGNYVGAELAAKEAGSAVEGVIDDAKQLHVLAIKSRNDSLLYAVLGSCVGVAFLLVFGFFGWRFLKRWYLRKVLDANSKLEVSE